MLIFVISKNAGLCQCLNAINAALFNLADTVFEMRWAFRSLKRGIKMRVLEPMWIAISTYSVLPTPRFDWNERSTRFSICFLPLVGLILGAVLFLWSRVAKLLAVDSVLFAATATALPLLLTGGIHMDGFMDTVDALASHQPREKKLAIMKDSHAGAFAVLYCGIYLLLSFGLYHALYRSDFILIICVGFVLSRVLTVIAAVTIPNARKAGMLYMLTEHAHARVAMIGMLIAVLPAVGSMVWVAPVAGGLAASFVLFVYFAYRAMAMKQFGGATGDTTGFLLQACELALLLGTWIGGLV